MKNFQQHEFNAEWVNDKRGQAILLTQSDGYSEPQTVLAHPWQFRAVCEHFGIVPTGDDQARRTIAALTRRLLTLTDKIADLRVYVANHSDHKHADLHVEMVMLNSLGDLANEWALELEVLADCVDLQNASERPLSHDNGSPGGEVAQTPPKRSEAQSALL